jgi:hypothetical protein
MTTEQRLERLEQENRWMRWIGAVAVFFPLAALAAVFLVERGPAQIDRSSQPDEELPDLVVRSLTVKDKDGNVRTYLTTRAGQALMKLVGKDGNSGVYFSATSAGAAGVNVLGKDGRARAYLGADADGAPLLSLKDDDGKVIWKAPGD